MDATLDYGKMMRRAMRGLIHELLEDIAAHGLPGDHHFFVTFETSHPKAELSNWLRERFSDQMTIVIQHEYEDLEVDTEGFSVSLSFGDTPERLYIPYDALVTFVDPSVEFGVRFDQDAEAGDAPAADDASIPLDIEEMNEKEEVEADFADMAEDDAPQQAEIVSLDQFRK